MEDHTIRLLQECSKGCKMGIKSMNQVIDYVNDSNLRRMIETYKEEHRKLEAETDQLLMRCGQDSKPPEMMATAMSWISTEMKMMMHDDDKQVAKIMMDGCNMGIESICGFINQYASASQAAIGLAKNLIKTEEEFRDKLKPYV